MKSSNYTMWSFFFKVMCSKFNLLPHIDGILPANTSGSHLASRGLHNPLLAVRLCCSLSHRQPDQDVRALWLAIEGRFRNNKDTQAAYLNQLYLYKKGYKVAGSLSQRDPYNKICQLTIISRKDLLLDNHSIQA
jgi:hypothetical protein